MKLLRLVPCLAVLVFALASCGDAPPLQDVEVTDSALHDANGMWLGGPNYMTGTYSCGGQTWTMKGAFDQTTGGGGLYLSRIQPWFSNLDSTRPELTVSSCIDANEGNQFFMLRSGSDVLYNRTRKTCMLYSHTVGQTSWTLASSNASIETYNFQYVKPGPLGIQDRFQVWVSAASGVGNPGVCSLMFASFYFSAP